MNLGPLRPILVFALVAFGLLTTSRILLAVWMADRVSFAEGWVLLILQGARIDIVTLCWLFILPSLFASFLPENDVIGKIWRLTLRIWLVIGLWFLVCMELATPPFIMEYDLRPNRLFVEYLIYPKEVFSMLWTGYKLELFIGFFGSTITLVFGWLWSGKVTNTIKQFKWYWRPVIAISVVLLGVLGARSTLGHRPINPAMVAFSNDPLVNDLVLNSSYSLLFAVNNMKSERSAEKFYGEMAQDKVIELVKQSSAKSTSFIPNSLPTLNQNIASFQGKRKNLVILLQESLGARFVGGMGGLALTPNLDKLLKEGWAFNQMYATGTRSVRGIEAITTGFPPTPSRAVVKLSKSQTDFFTIADLLKNEGYHTQFIYGGEAHFDNMKSFFLGNGFEDIVEEKDYQNPTFKGSWGVSDEDLYTKAHQEFTQLTKKSRPFFSLVFTSSNHSPFEYPEGKIKAYDSEYNTRNNTVRYSDYALGRFFDKAKQSKYWSDTVFIIIADHDARAYGSQLVPVNHFHIPAVILGSDIAPRSDERLVSNLDMPLTLLSLIGVDSISPMIGRDMTQPLAKEDERVMMQFDKNYGYLTRENLVVFSPGEKVSSYTYNFDSNELTPAQVEQSVIDRAKANALFGSMAYKNNWYKSDN
ncbi:LTA synthase family protein [uncultured Shewanella sp.]|uniref:LTA synthase family protein n=1 Tax=uncultured Shewanella sp. TaxID=173975 RepID=UPI0026282DD2|nr:LTA synthase family protein [uncultured Shewanella sp.]